MTPLYVTINDETGSFIAIDAIKAVFVPPDGSEYKAIIIDFECQQCVCQITPRELRARIDATLQRSVN